MKYDASKLMLPDGVEITDTAHDRFFIRYSGGIATIYPFKRNYALGCNSYCQPNTIDYNGRGWLQKIVDSAVKELSDIWVIDD